MDLTPGKNLKFAFFLKICSYCLLRLGFYLERQQTLFLDLFLIKRKKNKFDFFPKSWTIPFQKMSRLPFFKSMFLLSRQACFLTRTLRNHFFCSFRIKTKLKKSETFDENDGPTPLEKF